jgi:hypothetical protein
MQGYLGQKFAQDMILSLNASVCFEQLYSEIDGDSASSTELYAILSALSNIPITNYNTAKNIYGKIIKFNRDISTPINNINQIYPNQNLYTPIRENYSSSKSNNYHEQDSSLVFSKRMQNYIHSQNLKRRFAEISKDSIDMRQNRLNNIIEKISKDKNKLNELKLMFGNNIEAQIYNGDLSDIYLNKIENILYYMDSNKSIIPLSKRFF